MFKIKDDKIEEAIKGKNVTFSRFVIQVCEYALDNMNDNSNDEDKQLPT